MALIVTDNSVRQINAALLSLEKKIGETNSEKAQDKQVVQMELKNVQYDFMAPLYQSGNSVSINTTGTWEGNARSATTAEHAITADNVEHADTATSADTATTATTATNANITKTTDTVNGDKLQIGSGTAQNVTNAKHAATAEHAVTADNVENANTATSVNISKTLDTVNGDKLQIGSGTAQNVTNAKHAATADAFSTTYTSWITPAQAAAMKSESTIWPLRYSKDYLQTVTVTWDDYSSHTFPAGAAGMFFPGYGSNGGTLILVIYGSSRMLYNVWIDSNRWSGWHYIDMPAISYT